MNTVIVGSGAASLNAADVLYDLGQQDIAIVTEGLKMGTSRNTGSDKQTYYKLSTSGKNSDSIYDMAKTLYAGGAMHGDIALVEAAMSSKAFYKLVDIGVPFPHDRYGQFIGYKTDHDPYMRASSAGPLTSRIMTEKLEEKVLGKGILIYDGYQIISILTDDKKEKVVGLLAINLNEINNENYGLTLFNCKNIIYGTGGPAGIYFNSVYPLSHMGSTGIALEAGAKAVNLTESQYGLGSLSFRWNVSGTYQQVIPRYISTDMNLVDEKEFLIDYFKDAGKMMDAVFLKGYQWPFDPRKIEGAGSSIIDILVYVETQVKGRRVFMDFTRNPYCGLQDNELDFSLLGQVSYEYLEKSGVLFGKPIDRLYKMNPLAIELYNNNGIDISKDYLEVDVCAQHCNGGLSGNIWWESNLKNFFPIGEVNGTFGVYRPGGSALNSTQVGGIRASQYINKNYIGDSLDLEDFEKVVKDQVLKKIRFINKVKLNYSGDSNVVALREKYQKRMTRSGTFIRKYNDVVQAKNDTQICLENILDDTRLNSIYELPHLFRNYDILVCQYAFLSEIEEYIKNDGQSRGSYVIENTNGSKIIEAFQYEFKYSIDSSLSSKLCETLIDIDNCKIKIQHHWVDSRPIPEVDGWFESVWKDFRENKIF
jgi:succinate dehydrogenase/fumarate reductase flavoprotein subunit